MSDPRETRRSGRKTPSGSTPAAGRLTAVRLAVAVAVLTVSAAWGVRLWAERSLAFGEPVPLAGDTLRLTLGENAGVAFGLFRSSPLVPWLAALALIVFALLLARPLSGSRAGGVSLGLILGGGIANLLDRIGDGRVTDYLDAGLESWRWPTSNLPDVAITTGFVLAVWWLARAPSGEPKRSVDYEEDAR